MDPRIHNTDFNTDIQYIQHAAVLMFGILVNESYLFDVVFALVKPFLTEKIRERIRFHGADLESLHR
jgi:hypothetical protein